MDTMLEAVMASYGIQLSHRRQQMVHCPNGNMHSNNDRATSLSVNLMKGVVNCHACGMKGSAVNIIMAVEGVSRDEAVGRAEAIVHAGGGTLQPDGVERRFLPRAQRIERSEDHPYLPSRSRNGPNAGRRNGGG